MELFLCVVTHPFLWIFIGLVGVAYAIQWLVSQRFVSQKVTHFDITGLIQTSFGLNHVPKYVIRLIWYLWIILFLAMLFSILFAHYNIILMISRPDTKLVSLSVSAYALPAMVVPLSALIAFPITVLRQHYNRRQTEAEEEGLITDRINAAVASHTRPMHWPDMILDGIDFDTEYKKWVDDTEGYKFDRSLYEPNMS